MKVKTWRCTNCGHEVPLSDNLEGLKFEQYSNLTSRLCCPSCRSYTIQQAYDQTFRTGIFLVVKSHTKAQKGRNKNYGNTNRRPNK